MVGRLVRASALASLLLFGAAAGINTQVSADDNEAVLRCTVDQVAPATGSQVNVACSLIDNFGAPLRDTDLTFFVNFENKADTSWENGRKTTIKRTDSKGQAKAVLSAGNSIGSLGILVNYPGIYSSYTFLTVVAGTGAPSSTTTSTGTNSTASSASTGPSTSSTPTSPSTGFAPQATSGGEGAPE